MHFRATMHMVLGEESGGEARVVRSNPQPGVDCGKPRSRVGGDLSVFLGEAVQMQTFEGLTIEITDLTKVIAPVTRILGEGQSPRVDDGAIPLWVVSNHCRQYTDGNILWSTGSDGHLAAIEEDVVAGSEFIDSSEMIDAIQRRGGADAQEGDLNSVLAKPVCTREDLIPLLDSVRKNLGGTACIVGVSSMREQSSEVRPWTLRERLCERDDLVSERIDPRAMVSAVNLEPGADSLRAGCGPCE